MLYVPNEKTAYEFLKNFQGPVVMQASKTNTHEDILSPATQEQPEQEDHISESQYRTKLFTISKTEI